MYDLTPIKGSYIVNNQSINYYINIYEPGIEGVGGLMEFNKKNYASIALFILYKKNTNNNILQQLMF